MKKLSMLMICAIFTSISVFAEKKQKPKMIQKNAVVHIYRPARVVGFGWVFKLKIDGGKVAKVKNGKEMTLELGSGKTEFKMMNSSLEVNLEPGKHYYLRASLIRNMFLGKPELVEVTDNQAQKEMANL